MSLNYSFISKTYYINIIIVYEKISYKDLIRKYKNVINQYYYKDEFNYSFKFEYNYSNYNLF